jgi:glycerophosphoryl diester phosphodiesterase
MNRVILIALHALLLVSCTAGASSETPPAVPAQTASLPDHFDLQGHRGSRGLKPENTLPGFELALDLQVTTLELDLHFSADQVPVIWHDPRIEAAKCRRDPLAQLEAPDPDSLIFQGDNLLISRLALDQLQTYLCDRNPDRARFPDQDNLPTALAGADFHILSLAELFDFVAAYSQDEQKSEAQRQNAARVQFNIETKRDPDNPESIGDGFDGLQAGPFERAILELVMEKGLVDRVILQSFDHRSLWAMRALNDQIRLAALTSGGRPNPANYADAGASIWSPNYRNLTPALLEQAHQAGLLVIPWTVNDPQEMDTLIARGVDGLITDRPDILAERIANSASEK